MIFPPFIVMFVQFFGGFLLNKGVVSSDQLIDAMKKESTAHIQLGTLAMHASLMTAEQILYDQKCRHIL